jgi:hypothetical protein
MVSDQPKTHAAGGSRRTRQVWWKLALRALAVAGLVTAGLIAFRLSTSLDALGSGGIPTQIDGERVYRVTEQAEWRDLSGGFLLAANLYIVDLNCLPGPASSNAPSTPAERDLLPSDCSGVGLASAPGATTSMPWVAPKSSVYGSLFSMWGSDVILRVHIHDPEANQCGADKRARCDAAVVVETIVWPTAS